MLVSSFDHVPLHLLIFEVTSQKTDRRAGRNMKGDIVNTPLLSTIAHAIAASCGVVSHLAHFIHGEHYKQAILFFKLAVLLPATLCVLLVYLYFAPWTFCQGVWLTGSITATYLGALWTSMIGIYRSFFHRLHHFPGPRLANVSKLFHFFSIRKLDFYRRLEGWHQKYGSMVRMGTSACFRFMGFGRSVSASFFFSAGFGLF